MGGKIFLLYPIKERRPDFCFFFSGTSLIRCMEVLQPPPYELRRGGGTFSDFLLPRAPALSSSTPPSDFLMMGGRFVDSLSDRGFFIACTSSVTELVAISFCRAAQIK